MSESKIMKEAREFAEALSKLSKEDRLTIKGVLAGMELARNQLRASEQPRS